MLIEIATAIVVGEYVYIVGGEISSLAGGQYLKAKGESSSTEFNASG